MTQFQIWMGRSRPGERRTGSVAEVYARFFDIARRYIPPLAVLNDKLRTGVDYAGEHGIHLRWEPLQLTQTEYAQFCQELCETAASSGREYQHVESPSELRSWDDWSWWIYRNHIEPKLGARSAASPMPEELALRRKYRKALAAGNTSTAESLAAEIRQRYDPKFT